MGHGAWELMNRALYRAGKKEPVGRGGAYGERETDRRKDGQRKK